MKTPPLTEAWTGPGRKDGVITPFKPEYDALHIDMKKRGNAEWWYFDARLDNGYMVVAFFRAKHERTGRTGVEIVIYPPDGKKIQNLHNYPRSALSVNRQNANVRIGSNYITVDYAEDETRPTYDVYLEEGAFGFHLTYQAEVPGWMPGSGYTQFGRRGHFGWSVALPRARVQGTIKVHGQAIPVRGIGYHDHNWLNFMLPRVVSYWYWGRIYADNFTLIYAHVQCNQKMANYPVKVLMLAKGGQILLSTGEYQLADTDFIDNDQAGNCYPASLRFTLGEQLKVSLKVRKIIDADNLLFEVGPGLRFVLQHLLRLKPAYFRFASDFQIEVEQAGQVYKEQGQTLHEMVVVK